MKRTPPNLDALFNPKTVAILGASRNPSKIGHIVFEYMLDSGAKIFPVNPSAEEVLGHRCYPTLESIPDDVDMAVLALPASATPQAVRECVKKGVKAIVCLASGFGEIGSEGRRLEEEIKDMLASAPPQRRPSFLGPNTLGLYIPKRRIETIFTSRERNPRPGPGGIAFISQSGATAVFIMEAAAAMGVGFSAFVGIGNKLDVGENELLDYFAADLDTSTIIMYLESFTDGRLFLERCREIVPKKPVIVLKAGRSESGAKAAALHTGSLAGSDRVVDGALMQARVFRAYDEEELIDLARALDRGRPFTGGRVAVLTTAGGMGVIATDLLESHDKGASLKLAPLSEGGRAKLRSLLLPFASANNPVDVTANASNDHYAAALEVLESEPEVDAILCIMQFQSPFVDERLMDIIIDWFHRGEKSIVVTSTGGELSQQALKILTEKGVPAYSSLRRGVRAISALHKRGVWLSTNSMR